MRLLRADAILPSGVERQQKYVANRGAPFGAGLVGRCLVWSRGLLGGMSRLDGA